MRSNDENEGYYPIVLKQEDGHEVLIVHASRLTKYLGNLTIAYNKKGQAIEWDGNPIFLDENVEQDEEMEEEVSKWIGGMTAKMDEVVGTSTMVISNKLCFIQECELGNFFTDAMIDGVSTKNKCVKNKYIKNKCRFLHSKIDSLKFVFSGRITTIKNLTLGHTFLLRFSTLVV